MTKTEKAGSQPQPQAQTAPSTDDLRTACEIHTLAQMVYSQFQTPNPYVTMAQPPIGYTPQVTPTMPDPRLAHVWGWPQVWRY